LDISVTFSIILMSR